MKIKEAITRVDRSANNTDDANIEDFARIFDINVYYDDRFGERVKKHWLYNWICTDTWVGFAVYYMDDAPVAVSFQGARKSDEEIEFVSKEAALKVREFILSLTEPQDNFAIVNLDEELGDGYTVSYGSQLLTREGALNGEPIKVVHTYSSYAEIEQWGNVDIQLPSGEVTRIGLDQLNFAFKLAKE